MAQAAMALGMVRKATSGHSDDRVTLPGHVQEMREPRPPGQQDDLQPDDRQRGDEREHDVRAPPPGTRQPAPPPPVGTGRRGRGRPDPTSGLSVDDDSGDNSGDRSGDRAGDRSMWSTQAANRTATARSTSRRLRASKRWRLNSGRWKNTWPSGREVTPGEDQPQGQDRVPDPPLRRLGAAAVAPRQAARRRP